MFWPALFLPPRRIRQTLNLLEAWDNQRRGIASVQALISALILLLLLTHIISSWPLCGLCGTWAAAAYCDGDEPTATPAWSEPVSRGQQPAGGSDFLLLRFHQSTDSAVHLPLPDNQGNICVEVAALPDHAVAYQGIVSEILQPNYDRQTDE